jgi:hypothetical protein
MLRPSDLIALVLLVTAVVWLNVPKLLLPALFLTLFFSLLIAGVVKAGNRWPRSDTGGSWSRRVFSSRPSAFR